MVDFELIWAIEAGDLEGVEKALADGAPANGEEFASSRPLHLACAGGHLEIVERLLAFGADPNGAGNGGTDQGRGPALGFAAAGGHVAIMERLLAAGADLNARCTGFNTAAAHAAGAGQTKALAWLIAYNAEAGGSMDNWPLAMRRACRSGHVEAVSTLLAAGARLPPMSEGSDTGLSPLLSGWADPEPLVQILRLLLEAHTPFGPGDLGWLARFGPPEAFQILMDAGGAIDVPNEEGQTALHQACAGWHPELVSTLLAAGVEVNPLTEDGMTPLHFAVKNKKMPMAVIDALLGAGAKVNVLAADGQSPLCALIRTDRFAPEPRTLPLAKKLLESGAEPDGASFIAAVRRGDADFVVELLALGASVAAMDAESAPPLYWAAHDGHTKVVRALHAAGADLDAPHPFDGETALHAAVKERKKSVVNALIRLGAQLDVKDSYGLAPMAYASPKLRELLHSAMGGSKANAPPPMDFPPGLACTQRGATTKAPCTACGWTYDKGIKTCPWCARKGLVRGERRVLHGNPLSPASDSEVEFRYRCDHCQGGFWSTRPIERARHVTLYPNGEKGFFSTENGGRTWTRTF